MEHKTLEIDYDNAYTGKDYRPIYHQCTMTDRQAHQYGWYGYTFVRCGGNAMYLASFWSESANRIITHHVCDRHLAIMIKQAQDNNCAINDLR